MEKEEHIDQSVISNLKNFYGIKVASLMPLEIGADSDALIYKVPTHNQKTYFVKLKRGQHEIPVTLQLLLHDTEIKEIICPIKTLNGQSKVYINDFTITVYPFIDGQDGFSQNLTDDQWISFGKALKQIHQFQLPASIKEQIKQESYSAQFRSKVKSIYKNDLNVTSSDEIASEFLASLKKYKSVILKLVDRAEKLADIIQKQSIDFVLCHGDTHAGNVFLAKNGALYIVDWDQPIMAPEERDLMFIGGGIGNVWNNQHELELFYLGYGKTAIKETIIDYYRCERIIQDVAEYYQHLISENIGYNNRLTSYNHFIAMFKTNGVVDIAFKNK